MQVQVGLREAMGVTNPRCPLALVEKNTHVPDATVRLPPSCRRVGGLHRERGPQRLQLRARCVPMSCSQEACGRWSTRDKDAYAVADLDQAKIGEGRQSLAQNRKADPKFQGECPRRFESAPWPQFPQRDAAANLVRNLGAQRPPINRAQVRRMSPPVGLPTRTHDLLPCPSSALLPALDPHRSPLVIKSSEQLHARSYGGMRGALSTFG
jgi:hypothetical protein